MARHAVVWAVVCRSRCRLATPIGSVLAAVFLIFGPTIDSANAQADSSIPSLGYHAAFSDLYQGNFKDAGDAFISEGRGAIKGAQFRWIDSICYETMLGECYYHMGHLDEALGHYTAAVQLVVAHSEWMRRVQFPL